MISHNIRYILFSVIATGLLAPAAMAVNKGSVLSPSSDELKLHRHIAVTMPKTVRTTKTAHKGSFSLPEPFSVPCISGGFHDMFYWDTYFTNAGLLLDGDIWQSRNNITNIAAMIDSLGYMPNATTQGMVNRSQPPLFSMMVKDYYDATGDKEFLASMIPALEKEYSYWMTNRIAPNGLNRYGHSASDGELSTFFGQVAGRVRIDGSKMTEAERRKAGAHLLAEAESGWDFNPRFEGRCMDYNPVDLNAILYGYERNMATFLKELGRNGSKEWNARADRRRKLMRKLMIDPRSKLYYDYDFVNQRRSPQYSAAALTALWQGVADKGEASALVGNLALLEADNGLLTCAKHTDVPNGVTYQWDAPNGWAPIHFYAIKGLDRYGYKEEAARIAKKYLGSVTGIYGKTGQLWEKFNAEKGNTEVNAEYPMPGEFMGWTAGTYQTAYDYLYGKDTATDAPRVVNIINFIRQTEPRRWEHPSLYHISDTVLYETVEEQIKLMDKYGIRGSFLIEYDALINPKYQKLLKEKALPNNEVGGWWEITEPHVKAAGLQWRGRYPWDWYANVGFSTGYTPEEREILVDVYMDKYKEVFGEYPKSVGSWFIDSHSLAYMRDKYGIEASVSCRDQIGTDGYNLWGGYWQGGYYPSRKNFYIPAQTQANQIDVPVFRMLGSDPIAQYDSGLGGNHQAVVTLEPVYGNAGGNDAWVDWFFEKMVYDPAMNLSYFQAGQENMFTWQRMRHGLEYQFPQLARLAQKGDIRLETLLETGRAFRAAHPMTPASAISAMDAFGNDSVGTVWFNSRNYRLNLMWEGEHLYVRDIHVFDENQESIYLKTPCTTEACQYWTLPMVDGNVWSNDSVRGCIRFYKAMSDGSSTEMTFGTPAISNDGKILTVVVPVTGEDAELVMTMADGSADFSLRAVSGNGTRELPAWYAALEHAPSAVLPFTDVAPGKVSAVYKDYPYSMEVRNGVFASGNTAGSNDRGAIRAFTVTPEAAGFTLLFGEKK